MAMIYLPSSLLRFTENQNKLVLQVNTVGEIFPAISRQCPRLHSVLFDEWGALNPFVNCYIDGKSIESIPPSTPLLVDTTIDLVTALVGG
jgi:sulfur-carrier protein